MARSETARPFGERKQRLVLYVGLLFAALAAILVVVIAGSSGGGGGGAELRVAVANEAIPAGTVISAAMLDVDLLPAGEVDVEAFTSRSAVVGRVASEDIPAQAPILSSQVSETAGEGLTFAVSPGMRAISIDVREVVTAGGNVQPGDEVDVVGVFEFRSVAGAMNIVAQLAPGHEAFIPLAPLTGDALLLSEITASDDDEDGQFRASSIQYNVTLTVAQGMKVLALAQTSVDQPNGAESAFAGEPPAGETEPGAVTATLEVTPEQAQILALANQYGALRLALRNFGDDSQAELVPVITLIDSGID